MSDITEFPYDVVIVEDSRSGFQLFERATDGMPLECVSAFGKSNILTVLKTYQGKRALIVADGAAFGPEIRDLQQYRQMHSETIDLFLPESFEWLILHSDIFKGNAYVRQILDNPIDYIESKEYFSWELFFEALLVSETKDLKDLQYNKSHLADGYKKKQNMDSILNGMK